MPCTDGASIMVLSPGVVLYCCHGTARADGITQARGILDNKDSKDQLGFGQEAGGASISGGQRVPHPKKFGFGQLFF